MRRIVIIENMDYVLDIEDIDYISTLVDMSEQIKSALGLRTQPLQLLGDNRIKATSIIGNISLNNINLIILPKFNTNINDDPLLIKSWIHRLYYRVLKCSQDNLESTIYFSKNQVIDDDLVFTDVIAEYYIKILSDALKKSHIITYEEHIDKLNFIRGKILVQKQLSQPIKDSKTWCKYKKISRNNIFNQLLGWACHYLYNSTSNVYTRKKLFNLIKEFPTSFDMLSKQLVKNMKLPRNFNAYGDCIQLARNLYLANSGVKEKPLAKGNRISGYVINMEKAFENIVSHFSKIASIDLGLIHKKQQPELLAINQGNPKLNYNVRPDDIIVYNNDKLIFDAKYKIISDELENKNKPNRDDVYQMISSCIAYNSWEAILIYPKYDQAFTEEWEVAQNINGKSIIFRACTIDINTTDFELISAIRSIIENTEFYRGVINDSELSVSV